MKACRLCNKPVLVICHSGDCGWYECELEQVFFNQCSHPEELITLQGVKVIVHPTIRYHDTDFGYRIHSCIHVFKDDKIYENLERPTTLA